MALFECPRCGTKLAYASKGHPCKGGKSSDGGGFTELRPAINAKARSDQRVYAGAASGPSEVKSENETDNRSAGRKPDKSPSRTAAPADARPRGHAVVDPTDKVQAAVTSKRGRPKKGETRARPWEAEGISKASYYRRQAEKRK